MAHYLLLVVKKIYCPKPLTGLEPHTLLHLSTARTLLGEWRWNECRIFLVEGLSQCLKVWLWMGGGAVLLMHSLCMQVKDQDKLQQQKFRFKYQFILPWIVVHIMMAFWHLFNTNRKRNIGEVFLRSSFCPETELLSPVFWVIVDYLNVNGKNLGCVEMRDRPFIFAWTGQS